MRIMRASTLRRTVGVPFRNLRSEIGVAFVEANLGKQRQALSTGCLEQVDSETFSVGSLLIALTEKLTRSMVA
jgi:hypothetical protein